MLAFICHTFMLGFSEEPGCTSKSDYDYKMLQKMVELEQRFKGLEEKLKHQESLIEKMSSDGKPDVKRHTSFTFIIFAMV